MERSEDQRIKLATMLARGESEELSYELGEGEERTGLLLTYVDGSDEKNNYSARVELSPNVRQYRDGGRTLVDITDSNGDTLMDVDDSNGTSKHITNSYGIVQDPFRNLKLSNPPKTTLEPSDSPYEIGALVVDLEGGKLAVAPYSRKE
jgi:hypothetical protein